MFWNQRTLNLKFMIMHQIVVWESSCVASSDSTDGT
jgi:hypothetical protein